MVVAWPRERPLRQGLPRAAPWPGHAPYDAGSARAGPALIDESIDAEGVPIGRHAVGGPGGSWPARGYASWTKGQRISWDRPGSGRPPSGVEHLLGAELWHADDARKTCHLEGDGPSPRGALAWNVHTDGSTEPSTWFFRTEWSSWCP